jgi:hypothetical protein
MANRRFLSVRERSLRQLKLELEKIRLSDGYNNTVQNVAITRQTEPATDYNCDIRIAVIDSDRDYQCNERVYEYIQIEIWFKKQRVQDQATEFEMFLSDIRKALGCPVFVDTSHPQPQMTGIVIVESGVKPLYDNPQDVVLGIMNVEMEVFYSENSDLVWDEVYDVPVEQL